MNEGEHIRGPYINTDKLKVSRDGNNIIFNVTDTFGGKENVELRIMANLETGRCIGSETAKMFFARTLLPVLASAGVIMADDGYGGRRKMNPDEYNEAEEKLSLSMRMIAESDKICDNMAASFKNADFLTDCLGQLKQKLSDK